MTDMYPGASAGSALWKITWNNDNDHGGIMMTDKIIQMIEELKPGRKITAEDDLISGGILESMDIMMLAAKLGEEFDVTISPLDLKEENFKSVNAIAAMLEEIEDRF